jgi:hypothetical protein
LGKLPKDLKTLYDEIYQQIKQAGGRKPEVAVRAFQWVICSGEPLKAEVVVAAVSQDPEEEKTQPIETDMDVDFILDACRNLLVVDSQRIVRFSHLSVQEYFEEHHWNATQANRTVAKVCLLLLNDRDNCDRSSSFEPIDEDDLEQSDPLTKLLDYARIFWPIHVKNNGETDIDYQLSIRLEKFLGSMNESGPAYRSCYEMRLPLSQAVCTSYPVLDLSQMSFALTP